MSTVYPQLILKGSWYLRSKAQREFVLLYVPKLGMVWGFPFIWLETAGLTLPITNDLIQKPGLTYLYTWALSDGSHL